MRTDLRKVLDHLRREAGDLSGGQLLARFVTARDGAAFEALVRRHGKMVYGVCRRVLRQTQDAEDAFQQTFLALARKAASVVRRESVGSWLYKVAYHTALAAAASGSRRRVLEVQVEALPQPLVFPAEPEDWRPLLDREISLLPERYRAVVVLCDLEGRSRREAARQLGIAEGTLSSRLVTAHRMLAKRLAKSGLALSAGAVAAVLAQTTARAEVSSTLVRAVAKAAVEFLTTGTTPAAVFLGGLQAMFTAQWKLVIGAVMAASALAVVGVAFRAGDTPGAANAAPPEKPMSELEAIRKENELLKLNLQIVLEKFRALEAEVESLRGSKGSTPPTFQPSGQNAPLSKTEPNDLGQPSGTKYGKPAASQGPLTTTKPPASSGNRFAGVNDELIREVEAALKELKESQNDKVLMRLTETLKKLKDKTGK